MAEFDRIARAAAPRRARARVAVVAVALLVVAFGCSDDDSATPSTTTSDPSSTSTDTSTSTTDPTTSTTTTSTSPSSEQTVEEEVIARYIAYWDARFAANSGTPDPNDPALREYATGEQLDAVIAETQANLDDGLAFRPADDPVNIQRVDLVEIDGDHAVVQECVVTDGVIYRRETGEVVDDEVYTQNVRGELRRVDGAWRVSAARLIQEWEGVAGCAPAS